MAIQLFDHTHSVSVDLRIPARSKMRIVPTITRKSFIKTPTHIVAID